ncbi:MAG: carbon-nitrogen hydrolase family protein [Actinomycetota bacterium]
MRSRPPLILAVAQPRCDDGDLAANARHHAECIRAARARVVVFPELSLTGYRFDAEPVHAGHAAFDRIIEACQHIGTIALVGAPEQTDEGRHLSMWYVATSGARPLYRKMWLGEAEEPHFTAGDSPAVLEVDGWRLGLAICKDTGVPDHAAATAALGIDAYVAGVLEHDEDRDVPAVRARRIAAEHGVWVAMAAFAGSTGEGYERAGGCSGIWRPDGSEAARAGVEVAEVVSVPLTG